mmetsp:Transcript_31104/g.52237  ORF Transcript_31104/g.52237 Transcript_31104/m.52237 type:complete len:235 (+) Transcript_31104:424-1128(+)
MKAGTDSKKPHADKYYTGREFGTCKHVIAKAGANFVRTGERYGYAFYLQVMEFGEGLQFLHLDINCLHTHWRKLAVAAVQNSTDQIVLNHPARAAILQHHRESANLIPLVSEMHVKTHDFACQILFSPAFCPEADKSTGEEGELFHTSASKWTNTRQMGESGENVCTKITECKSWKNSYASVYRAPDKEFCSKGAWFVPFDLCLLAVKLVVVTMNHGVRFVVNKVEAAQCLLSI